MDTRLNSRIKLSESAGTERGTGRTLKFSAEVNYGSAEAVVEAVRDALMSDPGSISLDLAEVPLIDSSGLRALLQAKKLCEEVGAPFRIEAVSDAAARVIVMSGLAETFGLSAAPFTPSGNGKRQPDMREEQWQVHEYIAASEPSVVSDLRANVTVAAHSAGARGDTLCDIQIAVGEALTNAYRHGSPKKGVDRISVRCLTCPKAVVVEVSDEGQRFDFHNTCEPDPSEMRDHGMGIYLMRQAMDVVEFCCECPGNRVRMIKWL